MRFLLLLAILAGCAAPRDLDAVGPQAQPSALSYAATTDSLEAAPSTVAQFAVAARSIARFGLTPVASPLLSTPESRFTLTNTSGVVVAGLIPGQGPITRSELVVVGTDVASPYAPAVLEAARTLAERSQWVDVPGRSVQVVLWHGASSRRRALAAPVWDAQAVYAVLEIGRDLEGEPGLGFAAAILSRVLEAANEPARADSLSTAP